MAGKSQRLCHNMPEYIHVSYPQNVYTALQTLTVMIRYFRTALRHLLRDATFTAIHIGGLVIAIAAVLFILQYTGFEQSYDQFHTNKAELYRIAYSRQDKDGVMNTSARNFPALGQWVKEGFPEVTATTRFWTVPANAGFLITYNNKLFHEYGKTIVADSTFFTVFPTLLLRGNPARALKNTSGLVLSERMAHKIFGKEDPIGKIIAASQHHEAYEITGVLRNLPGNSHMDVDFIRLFDYNWDQDVDLWEGPWRFTYITLQPGTDAAALEHRLNASIRKLAETHPNTKGVTLALQNVTDIHLKSHLPDEMKANGNENLVTILLVIGLVIMILVWINYITLETSRFIVRAKEVGIRRIIGAGRLQLSLQFMVEYLCICIVAAVLAAGTFPYAIPVFSRFSGIPADGFVLSLTGIGWGVVLIFVLGSLVAGTYPALLLSKVNPVAILKGTFQAPGRKRQFQKGLMVFQFTVSIVLTGFVFVIADQLNFMRSQHTGMDLDQVIAIRNPTAYSGQEQEEEGAGSYRNFHALRNKLLAHPDVTEVASSSAIPGMEIGFTYVNLTKRNATDPYDPTRYKVLFVDYNFIPAYGITLKAGRNYSTRHGDDANGKSIVINERAARALGFASAAEALNTEISFMVNDTWQQYAIVGIVENYYHQALKEDLYPTIFYLNDNHGQQVYYSVKLQQGTDPDKAIAAIGREWKTIFPEKPMDYFFMNTYYDQQFKRERYFGRVFAMFACVALCIACLGILGMALFQAGTRRKEISIRKVMGASLQSLVTLLAKGYISLIMLAALIAVPLIHWAAGQWLQTYPVKTTPGIGSYTGPVILVVILTAAIAAWQIVRAATGSTIDNLRQE